MYVMDFLKENIYVKGQLDTCIAIIEYLEVSKKIDEGKYVSIYECVLNTNKPKSDIYQAFHTLLNLQVLGMYEFAICPLCDTENIIDNINRVKCSFCKTTFSPDDINERFKFIYEETTE